MMKVVIFVGLILFVQLACCQSYYEKLVEEIGKVKKSWKSGNNRYFEGKSEDIIRGMMGTLPTPPSQRLP